MSARHGTHECVRHSRKSRRSAVGGRVPSIHGRVYNRPAVRKPSQGGPGLQRKGVDHMKSRICLFGVLLAFTTAGLRAQGDRGIITGTVKDPSGAAMPNAMVTATHLVTNTKYKTSTTASGDFTVPALPVGDYSVRVENTGFNTQVQNNVAVAARATARVDVVMEVGTTQQTIEVQAHAAVLTTDTARVSSEVSARLVDNLPLIVNGAVRSPFDLAATTAEVAGSGDSNFRVGGGRIGAFGVTLDGTAATVARPDAQVSWGQINAPSVEALTEFSVES